MSDFKKEISLFSIHRKANLLYEGDIVSLDCILGLIQRGKGIHSEVYLVNEKEFKNEIPSMLKAISKDLSVERKPSPYQVTSEKILVKIDVKSSDIKEEHRCEVCDKIAVIDNNTGELVCPVHKSGTEVVQTYIIKRT